VLYTDNGRDFTSKHLEQVAADLKIRLVFSTPGVPRGRGRVERLFSTISTMLLCDLPGFKYPPNKADPNRLLTLAELDKLVREFLLGKYHRRIHSETKTAPARRHKVEHQRIFHRRQYQSQRGTELGTTVKDAVHPKEMQGLAERIYGNPGIFVFHTAKCT